MEGVSVVAELGWARLGFVRFELVNGKNVSSLGSGGAVMVSGIGRATPAVSMVVEWRWVGKTPLVFPIHLELSLQLVEGGIGAHPFYSLEVGP